MKYNIEDILKKAYMGEEENISTDELDQEVFRKLNKTEKRGVTMRGVSRFTRYAAIIIGLCLIATVSVSAYFIIKPNVAKEETQEKPAPVSKWRIEGDTLIISGYGHMYATNRNPMDEWLTSKDVIKKVIIEEGVTDIDGCAFRDFAILESVKIADTVTKIEGYAFENCTALKSIEIPDSVTEIGDCAFKGCVGLENVKMTKNLEILGENAFGDTEWFKLLEKDGMVVQDGVIYSAVNATGDIKIGEDITVVAYGAFAGSGITSVEINADIDEIGYVMFKDCQSLKNVIISSKVTSINDEAFAGCIALEEIELPETIKEIGRGSFYQCMSLKMVEIPEGVKKIGESAFAECTNLTTIYGVGGSLAEDLALNGDYEFVMLEEGEKPENIIKYDGYDYISPIYYNQTWKYDSEEIGCEVYEWSEEVVLPIPKPEGASGLRIVQGSYYLMGIDRDEWNSYVDMMSKKYMVEVTEHEGEGWSSGSISLVDFEHNFTASVSWSDYGGQNNMRNYCSVHVFVGSNHKNTQLSNGEVLNKVLEKLNYENREGFGIVNVSSQSNYKDGFDVYLVDTSSEYAYANDYKHSYICVIREDEIVMLDSLRVYLGMPASVEFLKIGELWKAYITEDNGKSGAVGHNLLEYDMVDGVFVKGQVKDVAGMAKGKGVDFVVLRKNEEVIDIYTLENNGSWEDTPSYGWYKLGEKVLVIDEEGIKEP